jgi:hypothetical protein
MTALRHLALDPEAGSEDLSPLMAKEAVLRGLDPLLALLVAREDPVSLAAASLEIEALAIPVPPQHRDAIAAARGTVGLPPLVSGNLEGAIERARVALEGGNWKEAADLLELALTSARSPYPPTAAEATLLLAEALWRGGRDEDALQRVERGLESFSEAEVVRALRVLDADIRFSSGDREGGCAAYRVAAAQSTTRWVELQLERCAALQGETSEEEKS